MEAKTKTTTKTELTLTMDEDELTCLKRILTLGTSIPITGEINPLSISKTILAALPSTKGEKRIENATEVSKCDCRPSDILPGSPWGWEPCPYHPGQLRPIGDYPPSG
jgi:hypothetical protein